MNETVFEKLRTAASVLKLDFSTEEFANSIRMYIWKQWKLPRTRVKNLIKLGMEPWKAYRNGNSSKGYWAVAGSGILTKTITNERLARAGYYSLSDRYESLHLCD